MTPRLYGLANCDTVRRARVWLEARSIACELHDFRRHGLERARLAAWIDRHGWERMLNRGGTTFRKLPEAERRDLDAEHALDLMLAHPASIRRPVLEHQGGELIGFDPDVWADTLRAA